MSKKQNKIYYDKEKKCLRASKSKKIKTRELSNLRYYNKEKLLIS